MNDTHYVFIDGGYLRACFDERLRWTFGDFGGIRFDQIRFGHKFFYYDCLDDLPRPDETQSAFELRLKAQRDLFERIGSLPSWHVQLGTLSGNAQPGRQRSRRQQKEVDVLLAVDMMNHAFRQNMETAVLLSGDLDFKPVVESLIHLGRRVEIAACPQTCSTELRLAADKFTPITMMNLFAWCERRFSPNWDVFFPTIDQGDTLLPPDHQHHSAVRKIASGRAGARSVDLYFISDTTWQAYLPDCTGENFERITAMRCTHRDRALVEKFLRAEFGDLQLQEI
jgi:uncharacterized LabA/DUF88 family protein